MIVPREHEREREKGYSAHANFNQLNRANQWSRWIERVTANNINAGNQHQEQQYHGGDIGSKKANGIR